MSRKPAFARLLALLALTGACSRGTSVGSPSPTAASSPTSITSAASLLDAMRARYAGQWYRTLTFVQKTTYLNPQTGAPVRSETWYEALSLPGNLRIDQDLTRGNGVLFRGDTTYAFLGNKPQKPVADRNPLLLLGFDVYQQAASRSLTMLGDAHIDVTRFHEGMFEGRRVFVVGALAGDTASTQAWFDAERLLFVRQLERAPNGAMRDIRFASYLPAGGGWLATLVEVRVNGRLVFTEQYSDVKPDAPLDPRLFDPAHWSTAPHWAKP
ncbi:MAG: hypothetical protein JWO05_153 [Gemmatimonadetes bacterium]|nr:hypothetical protein [Gemmatimonadota bacterium]